MYFFFRWKYPIFSLLRVLLPLAIPLIGNAAYKWVDKDGIIHYSQRPPPNREAKEVTLPAPTDNSNLTPKALEKRLQRLQQKQADQEKTTAEKADKQKRLAARKHNCEVARENLKVYQGNPRWLIGPNQENYTRLSEPERQERIAETKQQIKANCD